MARRSPLAGEIAASKTLRLAGVQFYCGTQQHIQSFAERRAAIVDRTNYLRTVLDALHAAGHDIQVVTGGGTGTYLIDAEVGVLNELQAGSYIVLDREYGDCELVAGDAPLFEPALFVDATVISANAAGMIFVVASLHLLWLNTTLLPEEIRPPLWRRLAPVAQSLFYGAFVLLWLFK